MKELMSNPGPLQHTICLILIGDRILKIVILFY